MKVLLDEDTPLPLKAHLIGHDVTTVPQQKWAGVKNGMLLGLIQEHGFAIFLTCDQNLEHQQNLTARPFALIVLKVPNKKMETLLPLMPQLLNLVPKAQPGQVYHVENMTEPEKTPR